MKKIIWLYPKLEKWMGGTRYVFECAKELSNQYEIVVICQSSTELVRNEFKKNNIQLIDLKSYTFTDLFFWIYFWKTIDSNINEILKIVKSNDIIISSMFPMNIIANKITNKHIQIIYEPFSFFYTKNIWKDYSIFHHIFFKLCSFFYKKNDISSTQSSNTILTLSSFEKENIRDIYKINSRVIYEGVNTNFFKPTDTQFFEKNYPNCFPIMHSTGFDSYKGTDLVFGSLTSLKRKIPNFKIFITYTRENKKSLDRYKNFVFKNNLKDNVIFLGLVPYEQLPSLYSFAKIYIEPGEGRSMSLSNKEAMACGTPVIAGIDAKEEIENFYNGLLVDPTSTEDLINKIFIIYKDFNNKDYSYSQNALNSINKKFTWKSVTKKICQEIENL